jgi:predicted CopG family antitoxin
MAKRIRVDEDTHAALASLRGDDETFDDLLTRLLRERHENRRSGAGLWEGSDAPERARETRQELKSGSNTRGSES